MHIMYLFALCLPILTGENAVYEVVGRKQWPNNEKVLGTRCSDSDRHSWLTRYGQESACTLSQSESAFVTNVLA